MIDRESVIEKSIETYLRNQLFTVRGYPPEKVQILDAFPNNELMSQALDRNYIANGWSADDGGVEAELGSTLIRRRYTFDYYVFGISRVWAQNLASVSRFCFESDGSIDLLDPADGVTVIGSVDVDFVSSQQVMNNNPRPWQENNWVVRLRVEDYWSSAGGH